MNIPSFSISHYLAAVPLLISASCATLAAGSTSQVEITSNPSGALVSASNGFSGETPCMAPLPNGVPINFEATHASFPGETRQHESVPSVSGWIAGNILAGGLIGFVIDLANPNAKVHKGKLHLDFEAVPIDPNAPVDGISASQDATKAVSERYKRSTSGGTM